MRFDICKSCGSTFDIDKTKGQICDKCSIELIRDDNKILTKELKELKETNDIIKENVNKILSRMITYDEVSDLTLSYVEDIQDELDKLVGENNG